MPSPTVQGSSNLGGRGTFADTVRSGTVSLQPKTSDSGDKKPSVRGKNKGGKKASGNQGRNTRGGTRAPRFDGASPDLKGLGATYVYGSPRQAGIFVETTKKITVHVGSKYRYGSDVAASIENNFEKVFIPEPTSPVPEGDVMTRAQQRIFEKRCDKFVDRSDYLAEDNAHNCYCAIAFLMGVNRNKFGRLIEELENKYTQGDDRYPRDLVTAYNMVNTYKNKSSTTA